MTNKEDLILSILNEIQNDTRGIDLIKNDIEELKQFKNENESLILKTVRNNSDLSDELNKRALKDVKNYLNTDESRLQLEERVRNVMDKVFLKLLLKWLGIQGTILSVIFAAIVKWVMK